jgi:nucleotide-binding universal stress UspA family protein
MPDNASAQRIVVGVDGSASSIEGLQWARRIATATGSAIEAVTAWELPNAFGVGYLPGDYEPDKDAEVTLTETIDQVFGADRPTDLRLVVKEGNAAKVLLDQSVGAQMLIVGSRGHGGFVGLLLGSVSATCAEHATCPVLVVHGERSAG